MIAIRLDDDVVEQIRAAAKKDNITNSEVIRRALSPQLIAPVNNYQPYQSYQSNSYEVPLKEDGTLDFDLHEECCLGIFDGVFCQHWQPVRSRYGSDQLKHKITGKMSYEYNEEGEWTPNE